MLKSFPYFRQADAMDCGPTCLRMITAHFGKPYGQHQLRELCDISKSGVSMRGIGYAAEEIGLRSLAVKLPYEAKSEEDAGLLDAPLPAVVHWNQNHFLVLYKLTKTHAWVSDPASGKFKLTRAEFERSWISDGDEGVVMLLEPTPEFYEKGQDEAQEEGFKYLLHYIKPYKKLIFQLVIGMLLGSVFALILPFLTQSVVDIGIRDQNHSFIKLVLMGQLMVFISQMLVNLLQHRILLHVSTRIDVHLVDDFLSKLMRLPIAYFDSKNSGDIMQRINDQSRIQDFLTNSSISIVFSLFQLVVFSVILAFYNTTIFMIFLVASILYIVWITFFLKKRKEIDYVKFNRLSDQQSKLVEIIQGMQEIKLQGSEHKHRYKWANIQALLFRLNLRSLNIGQYQDIGAGFIHQLKNILITFVAAQAVIDGKLTLGMMLSIQYIIGQLNSPLEQLIGFIRSAQDAKLSLERLNEIRRLPDENTAAISQGVGVTPNQPSAPIDSTFEALLDMPPEKGDILIEDVSFKYSNLGEEVLSNVSLRLPQGKVTAIVGTSGSGKTTLVKLLLGFYNPTSGKISVGHTPLDLIQPAAWRKKCGAVMQDGYIFGDTIAKNIAECDDTIDRNKLFHAVKMANIEDYIESLPLGYNTMIGSTGNGLSQGQKQRLLIARAVYRNPTFLFFDEATNALDANNERTIIENMERFYHGKTVVVVAHRLSTVRHADQIIVMEKGKVVEQGTHAELVDARGSYFSLVRNQLELGA